MTDKRKMNTILDENPTNTNSISFDTVFKKSFDNLRESLDEGIQLKDLSLKEKSYIKEFLKRNFKFYSRTSKFRADDETRIIKYIQFQLQKYLHFQSDISNDIDINTPLDEDEDEELLRIVNIFEEAGLQNTPDVSQVWISRAKTDLLSQKETYLILLIGDQELDLAREVDAEFNLKPNKGTKLVSFWKKKILEALKPEEKVDELVSMIACSATRAERIRLDYTEFYKMI